MITQWRRLHEGAGGLAAWAMGEGPVVLASHGIEDNWRNWTRLATRLADRFQIVALDLPWRSGNDYRWYGEAAPSTWLARAIDMVREPVHALLGHSFGAVATLELLSTGRQPDGLERAVLVAPFYCPRSSNSHGIRARSWQALHKTIRTGLKLGLGGRRVSPEVLAIMERRLLERLMPTVFPVFFEYFVGTGDLDLSHVDVPTLVLAGTTDPSLTFDRAVALAAAMPSVTLHRHAHFTHFCHLEQAGDVAGEVSEFLPTRSLTNGAYGQ